jgi:HD-GYP domain-containing protein (c-di-GMP phosphodiesterase class II)
MASNQQFRLAEFIASLSLATDLGMGQPLEQALRTCLLSVRAGELLGLTDPELADVYYLALMRFLGCTSDAHEAAQAAGGDEITDRARLAPVLMGETREFMTYLLRDFARYTGPIARLRLAARVLGEGTKGAGRAIAAHCEVAQMLSSRLGLPENVGTFVGQTFERWDGKGIPGVLAVDDIPTPVRIVSVARDVEVFSRLGGWDLAADVLRRRRGRAYDPAIAAIYLEYGTAWLDSFSRDSVWEMTLASEPSPQAVIDESSMDDVLLAFAEFVDIKLPFTLGHSLEVGQLAAHAGEAAGLSPAEVRELRQAGFVHDLGKVGIPNGVLEKRGPLSPIDLERIRLHPYLTERVLSFSPTLKAVASLAGAHHERLDGSGYHRGTTAPALPLSARILAAANAYQAMGQDRPHRLALAPQQRTAALQQESADGRLDQHAVDCVLVAAGQTQAPVRHSRPGNLTDREVEVLRLISRGASKSAVAEALSISPKTVGRHVENIYNKIDVTSRASAALFALQNGLLSE